MVQIYAFRTVFQRPFGANLIGPRVSTEWGIERRLFLPALRSDSLTVGRSLGDADSKSLQLFAAIGKADFQFEPPSKSRAAR